MDSGLQFVNVPMTKASVTLKRDDPGPVDRNAERKRHKKFDNSYRLDDQKVGAYNANELLSEQFLKEMMWTEIFDIYHLHFSTELPFIHMPTLKEKMGDKMRARRSDATNLVLLGILTLTARFHSDLGKYTASFIANGSNTRISNTTKPDPWAASEYFADTLTKALGPFRTLVSIASVEHVQALSDVEGEAATTASAGTANASADYTATVSITAPDDIVANEVVRRTMFSCFVLDRMLACGKKRTKMVRSKDLQIQLPCPDVSFDLSEKLVDIWGDISKYSFAGGRLVEKRPPWEESKFRKLRGVLDNFYENLPPTFTLTPSNYHRHEHLQASSTYVSLHLLGAVCRIMLHREYIPFIPIRCPRPVGPLDEPTFPEGSAPEGFWEESAEQVFKAAREIVDLTDTCQNRKKLPMSALVVFAVWTAAFVGIYAWHFPQMDMHNHMSRTADLVVLSQVYTPRSEKDCGYRTATHGPTAVVYAALKSMSNYLHMASTYVKYFHDMDLFYEGVKYDYYMAHMDQHGADAAGRMSVRQGGSGGGLEEWKVHGTKVTNNGTIALADDTPAEGSDLSREVTQSDNDNDNGNGAAERRLPLAEDHSLRPRWIAPAGTPLAPRPVNPVAAESNMHGIVYGHEGDARYSGGNMGSLQPAQSQHWNQSAQPTDQMPAAPPGSLDPTQLDPYLRDDPGTDPREFYNVPGLRWEDFSESQNLRWEEWEAASIERFARGGSEDEYY
ncbi:hypothetical protein SCUCBS95973_006902 [Sporothrix curviconia]|uniref:Uncharacterized protein n=1 Tax=Sporothrix curviconia TaxID=1260050 RepID=A0ABP0C8Z2_9PEZI